MVVLYSASIKSIRTGAKTLQEIDKIAILLVTGEKKLQICNLGDIARCITQPYRGCAYMKKAANTQIFIVSPSVSTSIMIFAPRRKAYMKVSQSVRTLTSR